jgi:hypothetical protein
MGKNSSHYNEHILTMRQIVGELEIKSEPQYYMTR